MMTLFPAKEREPSYLKILLIEDNPGDVRLIQEALKEYQSTFFCELIVASRLDYGLRLLSESSIDVVMVDLHLPDSFGYETFQRIHAECQAAPIIVLSSVGNEDLAVKTVTEGAQDYLFKDNLDNASLVIRSIRYAFGRFQTRLEIQLAETHLRTVIESTSDAILMVDSSGTIFFANSAAKMLSAVNLEIRLGYQFSLPLKKNEEIEVTLSGKSSESPKGEKSLKDSRTFAIKTTTATWDGDEVYCVTIRDITERKQMEWDLVKSRREAERLARMKSEFLANMSHEIRTPLNGVIGMTSLLLETSMTKEQVEYVETIRNSGEVLLNVLNDLLDISKIEAGRVELELSDFEIRRVVEECLELFVEQARQKDLLFTSLIDPDVPEVLVGDPWRLRQILSNLISNAVKFTAKGEVTLCVSLAQPLSEEAVIKFRVKDTGIGVSEEGQAKLFQPFSQSDSSMTRRFGGTGLGLAISKRLAELMGGAIGVESVVAKGSLFWVTAQFSKPKEGWGFPSLLEGAKGRTVSVVAEDSSAFEKIAQQLNWLGLTPLWIKEPPHPVAMREGELTIVLSPSSEEAGQGREIALKRQWKQSDLYRQVLDKFFELGEGRERQEKHPSCGVIRERSKRSGLVLVAEDNTVNQKIVLKMLDKLGCRADVVGNGAEAIKALEKVPYDLVLMDCQMPELDGFEATKQVREQEAQRGPGHRRLPIIAMTAHALKGDRERCLEVGMDDYLVKPLKVETLTEVLERWGCREMPVEEPQAAIKDRGVVLDEDLLTSWRELTQEGKEDFLSEVIDLFLDNTVSVLSALNEAIQARDSQKIQKLAHKLRGSSAHLGAVKMADLCSTLETLGERGETLGVETHFKALEEEFSLVKSALLQKWHS